MAYSRVPMKVASGAVFQGLSNHSHQKMNKKYVVKVLAIQCDRLVPRQNNIASRAALRNASVSNRTQRPTFGALVAVSFGRKLFFIEFYGAVIGQMDLVVLISATMRSKLRYSARKHNK